MKTDIINFENIDAVLFDVDGTLSDTDDVWVNKLDRLFKPYQILFPRHETKKFSRYVIMSIETPGNFVYHVLDRFHLDNFMSKVINRLVKHDFGRNKHDPLIVEGVVDMLKRLKSKYKLGIVSSGGSKRTIAFLEHYKIDKYFDVIVTSQTCKYTKPFPDPVIWAADNLDVSIEKCLMIGDTVPDIRAGKDAGAQTVGVLCGFGREKELLKAGANMLVQSTADITEWLT